MVIYVRGTYRQTQLFYWLITGRFTTTCFGPIPGPSSGLTVSATHIYCHTNCISHNGHDAHKDSFGVFHENGKQPYKIFYTLGHCGF